MEKRRLPVTADTYSLVDTLQILELTKEEAREVVFGIIANWRVKEPGNLNYERMVSIARQNGDYSKLVQEIAERGITMIEAQENDWMNLAGLNLVVLSVKIQDTKY